MGAHAEPAMTISPDEGRPAPVEGPQQPASPTQTRQLLAKRLNSLHKNGNSPAKAVLAWRAGGGKHPTLIADPLGGVR